MVLGIGTGVPNRHSRVCSTCSTTRYTRPACSCPHGGEMWGKTDENWTNNCGGLAGRMPVYRLFHSWWRHWPIAGRAAAQRFRVQVRDGSSPAWSTGQGRKQALSAVPGCRYARQRVDAGVLPQAGSLRCSSASARRAGENREAGFAMCCRRSACVLCFLLRRVCLTRVAHAGDSSYPSLPRFVI